MAQVSPIKSTDKLALSDVLCALSKARAAGYLLEQAGNPAISWNEPEEGEDLDEHVDWIRYFARDALHEAHNELERALGQLSFAPKEGA